MKEEPEGPSTYIMGLSHGFPAWGPRKLVAPPQLFHPRAERNHISFAYVQVQEFSKWLFSYLQRKWEDRAVPGFSLRMFVAGTTSVIGGLLSSCL